MRVSVESVRDELRTAVRSLDPEVLTVASAARLVDHFAEIERLAAAGKALAARRVAAGGTWRHDGARSPAEWLARTTGTTLGAAAAALGTAEKLKDLPDVDAAVRNGEVSPAQAEEIAAAAAVAPAAQAALLAAAESATLKELKDACAKVRAGACDERARHAELHRTRHLRTWTDAGGGAHVTLKTTPERLAQLHAALAPHLRSVFDTARCEGRGEHHDAYAHDALFDLLRSAGTGAATPGASTKTVVVVDHSAFLRGHTREGETCEIAGVGPIPVSVAKAMSADAFLAAVITRGADIVNVAHLGRAVTAEQRTALELRDRSCVVPGCDVGGGLEIDHTTSATGWADTKRTKLDELARLCRHHHHQKTYDGYALTGRPGAWQWRPPPDQSATAAA